MIGVDRSRPHAAIYETCVYRTRPCSVVDESLKLMSRAEFPVAREQAEPLRHYGYVTRE